LRCACSSAAPTAVPKAAAVTEIKAAADDSYPGLYELTPDGSANMTPYKPSKAYKIGLSNIGNQFPFVVAMNVGMEQAVKDMGLNLIFTDAQGDAQKQIAQMEDITTQKPDGTVLVALDANAVIPQLEGIGETERPRPDLLERPGRPPRANWPGSISLVGSMKWRPDARSEGNLKLLPDGGKVAIIEGAAGFQASMERSEGFTEILAGNPKIEIVASQPGNWTREGALSVAENFIQAHPDLAVIYAHDDNMALGAVSALKNANLLDKVKVVGIGGSIEGLESIKNGELHSTVYDSPKADTYVCIKALAMSLDGVKLPPRFGCCDRW
jgi:ribose transport system substrate-binding protein